MKCRKVFQALIKLAVEELCETADSLIAPVRLGVARPTAPFTLTSSHIEVINGSEELFSIEPLIPHSGVNSQSLDAALQTQQANNNIAISRGDVSAVDEAEGGEGIRKFLHMKITCISYFQLHKHLLCLCYRNTYGYGWRYQRT